MKGILPDETWKDIKGYEGYYQISNYGNARSLNRKIKYTDGRVYDYKGCQLTKRKSTYGYFYITATKDCNSKKLYIHRLVAEHFVDGRFENAVVNHKDSDPTNNNFNNLEWCTQKRNVQHGKNWHPKKEENIKNKIKDLYLKEKKTTTEIGKSFGVSDRTIRHYLKEIGVKIRPCNKHAKTPVEAFEKGTNKKIGEYESQKKCAESLGLDVRNLNAAIKGKSSHCKGYYFKYLETGG